MDVAFVLDSTSQSIKVVDVSNKKNIRALTNYRSLQTSASSAASLGTVKSISVDHVDTDADSKYDQAFLFPINLERYSSGRYFLSMIFRMIYGITFGVNVNYIQSPCLYSLKKLKNVIFFSGFRF